MSHVLTINGGSSSIRFAVFETAAGFRKVLDGKLDRIGTPYASLTATSAGTPPATQSVAASDSRCAVAALVDWIETQHDVPAPSAVGHRIVHGMLHFAPERVTPELLQDLKRMSPFDPEHLPREIELIEAFQSRYASVPHVACFDTEFHRDMPAVATRLAIPRRFAEQGIRRFGFHGLSYTFLMQELRRLGDPAALEGRVILAHLGGGASLAAVLNGRSIDTSMGFTPAAGLMMGTRAGDLDPGLLAYIVGAEHLTGTQLQKLINHESGLLGVSQSSADVRELLEHEREDIKAREALELFCYQAKKWIGSYAAILGGLDTLVFAGGVGENSAAIRHRICAGLQFIGIDLVDALNEGGAPVISSAAAPVTVRVIRTNEELVIAEATARLLAIT